MKIYINPFLAITVEHLSYLNRSLKLDPQKTAQAVSNSGQIIYVLSRKLKSHYGARNRFQEVAGRYDNMTTLCLLGS
jgi:hypothetical protein